MALYGPFSVSTALMTVRTSILELRSSKLVPPFERSLNCCGIRIFQVSANGHAVGKPGDADTEGFYKSGKIEGGSLSLNGEICGQHYLVNS